jgi:hypothetical protein
MAIVGWTIDPLILAELRRRIPPKYIGIMMPHCTLSFHTHRHAALPAAANGRIYGRVDDGIGVEALLISIDGEKSRPDGKLFHITWSLAKGRKPRESNDVIKSRSYDLLIDDIHITLIPTYI